MNMNITCEWCREKFVLEVPKDAWIAWMNGAYVQNAFYMLTPEDRELIISGTCGVCWDSMFGFMEDEYV